MCEAKIAVADMLGRPTPEPRYHAVSKVTFTDPEVGSVGLTEAAARAEGRRVAMASSEVPDSTRGWIHEAGNRGFIKLLADADRVSWSGPPRLAPWGARCSASWRWPCTPRYRSSGGQMVFAFPHLPPGQSRRP
jgi:hypothetical protein